MNHIESWAEWHPTFQIDAGLQVLFRHVVRNSRETNNRIANNYFRSRSTVTSLYDDRKARPLKVKLIDYAGMTRL
jgi:hypothetical protein